MFSSIPGLLLLNANSSSAMVRTTNTSRLCQTSLRRQNCPQLRMTALDWWKAPGSNYHHNREDWYRVQKTALKGRWVRCGLRSRVPYRIGPRVDFPCPYLCSALPLSLSFTSSLTGFPWVTPHNKSHASESLSQVLLLGNRLKVPDLCAHLEEHLNIPYSPSKLLEKSIYNIYGEYMTQIFMLLF